LIQIKILMPPAASSHLRCTATALQKESNYENEMQGAFSADGLAAYVGGDRCAAKEFGDCHSAASATAAYWTVAVGNNRACRPFLEMGSFGHTSESTHRQNNWNINVVLTNGASPSTFTDTTGSQTSWTGPPNASRLQTPSYMLQ